MDHIWTLKFVIMFNMIREIRLEISSVKFNREGQKPNKISFGGCVNNCDV